MTVEELAELIVEYWNASMSDIRRWDKAHSDLTEACEGVTDEVKDAAYELAYRLRVVQ